MGIFIHLSISHSITQKEWTPVYTECIRFLAKNSTLKLRDCDWQQIYDRLCADPEAFARYYPAGRAEIENDASMNVFRAILLNDDFYALLRMEQSGS